MYPMISYMPLLSRFFYDSAPCERITVRVTGTAKSGPVTEPVPVLPHKDERKGSFALATRVGNAHCPAGRPTSFLPGTTHYFAAQTMPSYRTRWADSPGAVLPDGELPVHQPRT
jgi:hypothetical protein